VDGEVVVVGARGRELDLPYRSRFAPVVGQDPWQVVVAVVIPLLGRVDGLTAAAGRRYQAVAWPAFGVLVATGILNIRDPGISWPTLAVTAAGRTLLLKLGFVPVSGSAAAVYALIQAPHARSAAVHPVAAAMLGSISLLSAVAAALFGVVIAPELSCLNREVASSRCRSRQYLSRLTLRPRSVHHWVVPADP